MLLCASAVLYLHSDDQEEEVVDEGSGFTFPTTLPYQNELTLVATGCRRVTVVGFKVYTVGLYIEKRHLKYFEGAYDIEDVWQKIMDDDGTFAVRLIPIRDVNLSHLITGMKKSMRKVLRASENVSEDAANLMPVKFCRLFNEKKYKKEVPLDFFCTPDGGIELFVSDICASKVDDLIISRGFLGMWLGADPIIDEVKDGFKDNLNRN